MLLILRIAYKLSSLEKSVDMVESTKATSQPVGNPFREYQDLYVGFSRPLWVLVNCSGEI